MSSVDRTWWFKLGGVLLSVVAILLLLVPLSMQNPGRVAQSWWDAAHVPAFALITCVVMSCLSQRPRMFVVPAMLLIVPLVELVQGVFAREQSFADMVYGWTGCLVGGLCAVSIGESGTRRWMLAAMAAAMTVAAMAYPVRLWLDDQRVQEMFPVLSTFDAPLERTRWTITGCDVSGGDGWTVTIGNQVPYPGLFLRERVSDWSMMAGLRIELELPGRDLLEAWVRIDDRPDNPPYFERFQKAFTLQPGTNTIHLDRQLVSYTSGGRMMNLKTIHSMGIFFSDRDAGQVIRLTKVVLELSEK